MNIIDRFFVTWINSLNHIPVSVAIWQFFTYCAEWGCIIFMLYLLITHKHHQWKSSLFFLIGLMVLLLFIEAYLKPLIARPRPFITYNFTPWITIPKGFSMPSGHSATAFYTATYASFYSKKYAKILMAMATIAAVSRLYLGVHYLTDVMAGALLGLVTAWLFHQSHHAFSQNKSFDI